MAQAPQESQGYNYPLAPSSIPEWKNPLNSAHTGSLEREAMAGDSSQTASGSPPEFRPTLPGRLFTAFDGTVSPDWEVHPTAGLPYGDLPQERRDTFKKCAMYLEKHLEFVNYLLPPGPSEIDERTEASEKERIKRLAILVPTKERDNKKWQCSVIGCDYKGTLQHFVDHLCTKAHLGIKMFACPLGCKQLFHHAHDRDRHKKTCIKSRQVGEAAEAQGSKRSRRGLQQQPTRPPPRAPVGMATHRNAQPVPASEPRDYYDTRMPSTSTAPPRPLRIPPHQTSGYQQMQRHIVPPSQYVTGPHPEYAHFLPPPPLPSMSIMPTNYDGMNANVITNNNFYNPSAEMFALAGGSQFPPAMQQFNLGPRHLIAPTYALPPFDPRASANRNAANYSSSQFPGQISGGQGQGSQQPSQYIGQELGRNYRYHEGEDLYMSAQGRNPRGAPHAQTGHHH